MDVLDIIVQLKENRISVELNGDDLKITAPKDAITSAILQQIKANKEGFITFLQKNKGHDRDSIPALGQQAFYPVSYGQKSLWILNSLEQDTAGYNMFGIYEWKEQIDRPALDEAIRHMVQRHEILRTVFTANEDAVFQSVKEYDRAQWELPFTDIASCTPAETEDTVNKLANAERAAIFDLAAGPLLRGHLVKKKNDSYLILLTMHHIISDAWSMEIFIRELMLFYRSLLKGERPLLPALRIQYKDFADWQNGLMTGKNGMADREYWIRQFSGELPVLTLAADFVRPKVKTYEGNTAGMRLDKNLCAQLDQLSRQAGCTRFSILTALSALLLHRYSAQNDFIVGVPVAGRNHPELENLLGYFVNTIGLRIRPAEDQSFLHFLTHVNTALQEAYAHQDYPLGKLVEDLALEHDPSRSPLFEVMISHQKIDRPAGDVYQDTITDREEASKFDLTIDFPDFTDGIFININYNTSIYKKERIHRMIAHFMELGKAVTANNLEEIGKLNYVNVPEREMLCRGFNNSVSYYPAGHTIQELFELQVEKTPEATAIVCKGTLLSYSAYNEKVNQVAHYLRTVHAVKPNERVGIRMGRSERLMIVLMGVIKSGAAYVPVDPAYPKDRQQYMMEDSEMRLILSERQYPQDDLERLFYWEDISWDEFPTTNPGVMHTPEDMIYLLYTSGSTGNPKGAMISHAAVVNHTQWVTDLIYAPAGRPLKTVLTGTINFDSSVEVLFPPLVNGSSLELIGEEVINNLVAYAELLHSGQIEVINLIPSHLHLVLQTARDQHISLQQLKYIITGGEVLQTGTSELFLSLLPATCRLVNGYGPTESTVNATYKIIAKGEELVPHSIGRPVHNTQIYVLDKRGQHTGIGIKGEICIGGTGLAKGYWKRPALTEEKFIMHPELGRIYRTGDMGSWSAEGELLFDGRLDHQVKIRGYRIELSEIEKVILRHKLVTESIVVVHENGQELEIIAYVVWKDNPADEQLLTHLAAALPNYMIPAHIIPLPAIPRLPNGKLDRKNLPAVNPDTEGTEVSTDFSETESLLVDLWKEILGKERISIRDNFFRLGGHSLKAMRLSSAIFQQTGVKVQLYDIFTAPTIQELAVVLEHSARTAFREIRKVSEKPFYELSHAQKRLWIQHQSAESETAYNIFSRYDWKEELDLQLLEKAFAVLTERHESLRTRFIQQEGNVYQQITSRGQIAWLNRYVETASADAAEQLCLEDINTVFDLEKGPLWKYTVIKAGHRHYVILLTVHHIIADAWSMEVFVQELIVAYTALSKQQPVPLQPLRLQYKDFTEWHNHLLQDESILAHRMYWRDALQGELPVIDLPADFPRPRIKQYTGKITSFIIPEAIKKEWENIRAAAGCSMFTLLAATVNTLIYRYTGQPDIITGIPAAGREHKDLEDQIGFYVNTIPYRMRIIGADSFRRFLQDSSRQLLESFAHQVYPFDKLVEETAAQTDRSRSPLFDIMINHERREGNYEATPETAAPAHMNGMSKFDIQFHFAEYDNCIELILTYNDKLYLAERIDRMKNHYLQLAQSIITGNDTPLDRLAYISETERDTVTGVFNKPLAAPDERSVLVQFDQQVKKTPGATAVICGDRSLTYAALNQCADKLAGYLQQSGINKGDRIGLMLDRSERMIIAIFAILKAGAVYVPLDPAYPVDRIAYLIKDSGAVLVITENNHGNQPGVALLEWDENKWEHISSTEPVVASAGDTIYIIYTSGSTGHPKGVNMSHSAVVNLAGCVRQMVAGGKNIQRFLLTASVNFDVSVGQIFGALLGGYSLVVISTEVRNDPAGYITAIDQYAINVLDITPSYLHLVLQVMKENNKKPHALQYVIAAGEILTPATCILFDEVFSSGTKLINAYGPTEACVYATCKEPDTVTPGNSVSIGSPLSNYHIYIADQYQQVCGIGIPGEICIAGTGLAKGYWNLEAETKDRFISHPDLGRIYRSGDYGYWTESGEIRFLGRKDNQIKIRGFRIELGEVEEQVKSFAAIKDAILLAHGESTEKELIAFIIWRENERMNDLQSYLGEVLPEYMIPHRIVAVEEWPRTQSGKADRKNLLQRVAVPGNYVVPVTETEKELCTIWESILKRDRIGIEDNFFESGGHSLRAMQIVSAIYQHFGVRISIRDVFQNLTVSRLALCVDLAEKEIYDHIKPAPSRAFYPLSHSQKRIWLQCQHEISSTAYNIVSMLRTATPVQPAILEKALVYVAGRHEIMRTIFRVEQGEAVQQVLAAGEMNIEVSVHDVSGFAESGKKQYTADLWQEARLTSFDLEKGPLFRCVLIKDTDEHIIVLTIHHIVSDAWSMKLFGEELRFVYGAMEKDAAPDLQPLPVQYKDYTAWQLSSITRDHSVYQQYWHNQFTGELPVLELPADYLRPAQKSSEGNSISLVLPAETTAALRALQARNGCTMFGLLLSTINALLYHYTGQTDIITGVPSSGRQHKDLENQLGCYINTLAVRVAVSPGSSFSGLINEVHHRLMGAYEHQFYPFDLLVQDLNIVYDESRSPLFDVLVNYEKVDDLYNDVSQGSGSHQASSANFDCTFHFSEFENCIRLTVDYSTQLFLPARIDRMLSHYFRLTDFICTNPDVLLFDQQYTTQEELAALDEFNQTSTLYDSFVTIQQVFEARVNKTPLSVAVVCDERAITYAELNKRANRLAHHLRNEFGIQPDDRIGLMMDRTENMIVAIMGILKSGAAYVPIDPNYPLSRCLYLVTDSRIKLLITDSDYLQETGIPALRMEDVKQLQENDTNPVKVNSANDHCYIIYTSGSTGKPKGVCIRHHSVINLSQWIVSLVYDGKESQCTLLTASLSFDASVQQLFPTLMNGHTLVVISEKIRTDPELYTAVLEKYKVDIFDITPSYLHLVMQVMEEKAKSLSTVKYVLVGGEILQQETIDSFFRVCRKADALINVYGPTETCVDATSKVIHRSDGPVNGSVGTPVNNLQVRILNEAMHQTGIGIPGELFIAGAGLASAYFDRPELTKEKFIEHPSYGRLYRTGDKGYWSGNGEIIFNGRADNQVKIRGYRIELGEIEKAAHEFPPVAEAVVVITKINGENELAIYVVWKNEVAAEELKNYLAAELPGYMLPSYWVNMDSIPRTPGGKTDRLGLPSPVQDGAAGKIQLKPVTETEEKLCRIWEELLGRSQVGINEKFVSLGGHSLKAIRMISKVFKETGARITIRDIFSHDTIQDLAALIDGMEKAGLPAVQGLPAQADYELSHAQLQLWMVHQMESGRTAYNIFNIYPWNGPLDSTIFKAALQQVIERHENLRTRFTESSDGVRFTIPEPSGIIMPLIFHDLSGMSASQADKKIAELGMKEKAHEFSLEEAPLFRITVIRKKEDEYLVLLTIHHIISDAWSVEIMLTELINFYDAFVSGKDIQPEPLPFQFRDFSQWHNNLLESPHAESLRQFWLHQLEGVLPVLDMPADYPRPKIKTYQGASVRAFLNESASQQLAELCSEAGCSMFTAMVACTTLLLHRYTGQADIITGVPVAGRDQAGLEQQLGYFVNTIPLRSRVTETTTFNQLLNNLKELLLQAYANQWYPADLLLDELDVLTDPGRSPLFDVMINYDKSRPLIREELVEDTSGKHEPASGKFDLLFHFTDYGNTQSVTINYNTAIYSAARIDRMLTHLEVLISNLSAGKNDVLHSIEYVPAPEYTLLDEYQGVCSTDGNTNNFQELFEEQVRKNPAGTALLFGDRSYSYARFNARVNELAHCLRNEYGILPGDRVGIMMDRSADLVTAIYAVVKSGAAYVPLDPVYPAARLDYIAADSGIKLLVSEIKYSALHLQTVPVFYPEQTEAGTCTAANPPLVNTGSDPAYIIYTSGSTGQPKGVCVTHAALTNLIAAMSQLFYQDDNRPERVMLTASVSFDVSVGQLFVPLMQGASLVIITEQERMTPDLYIEAIIRSQTNALDITPSYLHLILQTMESLGVVPASLKQVWVAGEAFQSETYALFRKLFPADTVCCNLYGPTEACVYSTYYRIPETVSTSTIPIGRPLANYSLYILDQQLSLCGIGLPGELFIGGAGLAAGYWNRSELTEEKFIRHKKLGRLYSTGDMGRWDYHGNIEYLGRKDNQVKRNGVRIELGEIESVVSGHPLVREAAVVLEQTGNENRLVAYIVWKNQVDHTAVQQSLSQQLPGYMVPGIMITMAQLPRNASGKLNRLALPPPGEHAASAAAHAAPVLPAEQLLCLIWEEVLGKEKVGIDDNFFQIGGHSLKAMRILTRVYQQMGKRLELKNIFEAPTIRELAVLLDEKEKNNFSAIQPVKKQASYPLSHAQKRLWIIAQTGVADAAYNIFHSHNWNDALSPENMEAALFYVIKRHEILRTAFLTIEGNICQKISKPVKKNLPFRFVDYSHLDEQVQQESLSALATSEQQQVFDLEKGPLLQMKLVRIKEDRHVILLTMHHIISDAWSVNIFVRDLQHAYKSYNAGLEPDQAPLRIQYRDFSHWQHELLGNDPNNEHRGYWHAQLSGMLPVLDLPADFSRPRVKTYNGAIAALWIGTAQLENLHHKSVENGCSLFTLLLAAAKLLLYRYTGQSDIIVGVPVAGRDHADLVQQIGYYVNAVALRTNFREGDISFTGYLQQIKDHLLACYAHQVYPLDVLVEELNIQTDRSRSPVFDVMINYEKLEYDTAVYNEAGFGDHAASAGKFDIVIHFSEYNNGICVYVNYNTDIYAPPRIKRLLTHLQELLFAVPALTDQAIGEINFIPAAEQEVLRRFNETVQTSFPTHKTVHQLLEQVVAQHPANPAVYSAAGTITYSELNREANKLAHYLRDTFGIQPDDCIGVMMDRSEKMIITLLAILKAGAAYVPLDPALPASRLEFIAADCVLKVIVTELGYYTGALPVIHWEQLMIEHLPAHNPESNTTSSNLCYVIYTSGSTGQPKGVMIEHRSLINLCYWHAAEFGVNSGSRGSLYAGISFDASVWETWPYLLSGAAIYPMEEKMRHQLQELIRFIQQHQLTHSFLPTPVFEELSDAGTAWPLNWKLLTGGDQLKKITGKGPVINNYGPTECTVVSTSWDAANRNADGVIPIGKPISNTQIYILDRHGRQVPVSVYGEIYIGGEGVGRGYINNRELTAQKFIQNPVTGRGLVFKSGDIGRWLEDGNIEFSGRKDGQVKLRGYRIEIKEIESALHQYAGMAHTRVLLASKNKQGAYLVCFYTGQINTGMEIRTAIEKWLPGYMIPSRFIHIGEFPLTLNGKIDDAALLALAPDAAAESIQHGLPQTASEKLLQDAWKEILGIEQAGSSDDFFELGGHSLKAIKLITAVQKAFGQQLSLKDIFNYSTISSMAALLDGKKTVPEKLLVKLNKEQSGLPCIYLVPPLIGSATVYKNMAVRMQGRCNCYGLQFPGFDTDEPFCNSVESLAGVLAAEISAHYKGGTVNLLGYSFGGTVAFEMAKSIEKTGVPVKLFIVDKEPVFPASLNRRKDKSARAKEWEDRQVEEELLKWNELLSIPGPARVKLLASVNYSSLQQYRQQGILNAPVITIGAAQNPVLQDMKKWVKYTRGKHQHYALPADHYSVITHTGIPQLLLDEIAPIHS